MKTLLHIVRKDFLFLRGRLAVWFAGLLVKFAIGFWVVLRGDLADRELGYLQGGVVGLVIFDAALTLLIAALLVQEDGVAGTAAFWRTRPIAGWRLLAAKVLGAALLLVGPAVVVSVPWWMCCGMEGGQMLAAAVEVVLFQGGLVLVAFTAASLTDSIGRCLVWGLTGVGAVYGIAGAWTWVLSWSGARGVAPGTLMGLQVLLIVPLVVAVVCWQFLTWRMRVGLAILVGGVVLAPPATVLLAVRLIAVGGTERRPVADDGQELTRGVQVEWKSARLLTERPTLKTGRIEVQYEVRGVPSGCLVSGWAAFQTVRGANGERLPVRQSGISGENLGMMAVKLADGTIGAKPGETRTAVVRSFLAFDPAELEKAQGEPLELAAVLRLGLLRPHVFPTLPAAPGPWRVEAGRGMRVMRLARHETATMAVLRESEPLGLVATVWGGWWGRWPHNNVLYVVRRRTGFSHASAGRSVTSLVLGGVQVRQRTLVIPNDAADASITLVDLSDGTNFARTVRVPRLEVQVR